MLKQHLVILVLFTIGLSVAIPSAYAAANDTPANFKVNSISTSQNDLYWDAVSGAETYKIYMEVGIGSSTYSHLANVTSGTLTYSHTGLNTDTQFQYKISAADDTTLGEGTKSSAVSNYTLPSAPTNPGFDRVDNDKTYLSWDSLATTANVTSYKVERSLDNSNWSTIISDTGSTSVSYTDTQLDSRTLYYYRVSALNTSILQGNESSTSTVFSNTTMASGSGIVKHSTPPFLKQLSIGSDKILDLEFGDYSRMLEYDQVNPKVVDTGVPVTFKMVIDDEKGINDVSYYTLYFDWNTKPLNYKTIIDDMVTKPELPLIQYPALTHKELDGKVAHAYVEWSKQGAVMYSSDGQISDFDVKLLEDESALLYTITFAKPIDTTDIMLTAISDVQANTILRNSLSVVSDDLPVTGTMSGSGKGEAIYDEVVVLGTINKWAGYDVDTVTDSEMLSTIGINGDDIPDWMSNVASWVHDGDLDMMDMINALTYLKNFGIIK